MRETNGSLDFYNSSKRLETSLFVPRVEFIRSYLSNLSAHVPRVSIAA